MTARNMLTTAPPYAVEDALRRLGSNLRTARIRGRLTIREVAGKIGTRPRPVSDAEKGKPSTGVAVNVVLLWTYRLLHRPEDVADPALDKEGLALALRREPVRVRRSKLMDNDFQGTRTQGPRET